MYVDSPGTQGSKPRERLDRGWRCTPCLHLHTIRFLSVKSTIQIRPSRKEQFLLLTAVRFSYNATAKTVFTSHWVPLTKTTENERYKYLVTPDFFSLVGSSFVIIYMLTPKGDFFYFYQGQLTAALCRDFCIVPHHQGTATYNVRHSATWSFTLYLNYLCGRSFVSRRVEIKNNCYVHQLVSGSERATEKEFV